MSSPDLLKKTQPVAAFSVLEGAVCSCLPRPTRLWHSEPFRGRRDSAPVTVVASVVGLVSITHLAEASRHRATRRWSQFLQAFQPLCVTDIADHAQLGRKQTAAGTRTSLLRKCSAAERV